jgi:hypothetical protein
MPWWSEWLRSVEGVWLVWATSTIALVVLAVRSVRFALRRGPRAWLADEAGSAYSMAFVLTMPFLVLLTCMVAETTLIIGVKMGTMYAAYCGARAQVVWRSAAPDDAAAKTRLAVVRALVPFAPAAADVASGMGLTNRPDPGEVAEVGDYQGAYAAYTGRTPSVGYFGAKFHFANHPTITPVAIDPSTGRPAAGPEAMITVTVRYLRPFYFAWMARIVGGETAPLGRAKGYRITSSCSLTNEDPSSASGTLGIGYVSE